MSWSFTNEEGTISNDVLLLPISCVGCEEEFISIPCQASANEVAAIIRKDLGIIYDSFFVEVKNKGSVGPKKRSRSRDSIFLHCSSIKASVLARYKECRLEIRAAPGCKCTHRNTIHFN